MQELADVTLRDIGIGTQECENTKTQDLGTRELDSQGNGDT